MRYTNLLKQHNDEEMKAYVINMPKSKHRREATRKMLESLGIEHEFIAAVDGREMSEDEFNNSVTDPKEFTRSQAGCALSHIKAYKRILESNDEYALILEDDIVITEKNFSKFLDEIEPKLNKDHATLLTYYWCRDGFLDLSPVDRDATISVDNTYTVCTPSDIHGIGRSAAYIMSKGACKRMIEFNMPLYAQADSWVVFHKHNAVSGVDCVYPMPITENDQFGSEIDYTRNKTEAFLKKIVTIAVNANLPIITPMIKKKRQRFAQGYKNIRLNKQ